MYAGLRRLSIQYQYLIEAAWFAGKLAVMTTSLYVDPASTETVDVQAREVHFHLSKVSRAEP